MTKADLVRLEEKLDAILLEQKEQRVAINLLLALLVEEAEDEEPAALTLDGDLAGGERDVNSPL